MDRRALKQVIADQKKYKGPKTYYNRIQISNIQRFVDDPSILIISGIRRSGKSTIQRILQCELSQSDYYLNFDDERLIQFKVADFQMLMETFIELYGKQNTVYFDEIQNIEGWERFVRRLYEQGYKIFITGSNAKLLSKELGTHLTGRYIQFEVYPLSFREVMQHEHSEIVDKTTYTTDDVGNSLYLFASYLKYGGIPEFIKFHKPEYLKDLYNGILFRDIVSRYNIKNDKPLRELGYYFASNVGKEFSYTKLGHTLGISSPQTVSNYCSYFEECYLFFFLNRYHHSLKKQIQSNKKCYMIDSAMIRTIGFRVSEDVGHLLENVAFLHLKMQGYDIYFHKEKKECDFIIREQNSITRAIQVTTDLSNEKVKKREVAGLIEAMEAYDLTQGTILTENEHDKIIIKGCTITVMPLWQWLITT